MTTGERIGFNQRIRLEWLEYAANAALAGSGREEIAAALRDRLRARFARADGGASGNLAKVVGILTMVWVAPPPELRPLRDAGIELLRRANADERMLAHWCMCLAAYPFFGAVAGAAGRLLRLQGTAAAAQVQRRLRERLGERETVARAARRVLRGLIDWGALEETGAKGVYRAAAARAVDNAPLALWAARAVLSADSGGLRPAAALLRGPRLFPFEIAPPPLAELEACEALETARDGFDREVLIGLARSPPGREAVAKR